MSSSIDHVYQVQMKILSMVKDLCLHCSACLAIPKQDSFFSVY